MGTGQANVKQYNRQLRNLIHRDKLNPGLIVSHELNLDRPQQVTRTSTTDSTAGPKFSYTLDESCGSQCS